MHVTKITVAAPAKINLFLHIVGKREDGYHLLDSLVAFADYGDVIEVEESDKISVDITGSYNEQLSGLPPENNLVWKAAVALQKYLSEPLGAKIILRKNLPIASGIGGGSADAAATLRALKELWQIDIAEEKLSEIALGLGSDVPVCLYGKPALMRGIGEQITPVVFQENIYVVLINPNIPLNTGEIFNNYDCKGGVVQKNLDISSIAELVDKNGYKNDLESAAISKLPIIAEILAGIRSSDDCFLARMSGSGATCFGLYHDEISANKAAKGLKEMFPKSWCVSARIL